MNKKFSTLVASLLLASSVGAYAQATIAKLSQTPSVGTAVVKFDETTKVGGYEVGKSYFLGGVGSYLQVVEQNDGTYTLEMYNNAAGFSTVADLHKALWTLTAITSPEGAIAPKYAFVNKYTGTVLSMNSAKAIDWKSGNPEEVKGSSLLGGNVTEWLNAPSYKDPTHRLPMYSTLDGDNAVVMAYKSTPGTNKFSVYLVKMSKSELQTILQNGLGNQVTDKIVAVQPLTAGSLYLSANDLNTTLGTTGKEATKESSFQMTFDPSVLNGNKFDGALQATAVDQFELTYGKDGSNVGDDTDDAAYASLYPASSKTTSDKYADRVNPDNVNGFKNTTPQYLALKNADGKYIVVDTAYVAGTDNNANGLIQLAADGLYNAKNATKYREPGSYLFSFLYNPTDGTVTVKNKEYIRKTKASNASATTVDATYYAAYSTKPTLQGSHWYDATTTFNSSNVDAGGKDDQNVELTRVLLGSTNYLTLGQANNGNVATESNRLKVYVGTPAVYNPTYVASGAYLIKVTGSKDAAKIGKYWVNNLKGGFEVMEQAVRQNFQHMPAAQWIVESNGKVNGSPVTITNREFGAASWGATDPVHAGILYGADNSAFFFGQDTLQFIPVADPTNEYLGYKYIADEKELAENVYTFNYLHDLAMDKPINTKSDKDSVVWVDASDNSTKFELVPVITDDYGYNGNLSGVAKLKRVVYYVKVKDASKLQNDKRYLTYNEGLKKYVVSQFTPDIKNHKAYSDKEGLNPDAFFLKENNEVAGENGNCYYAFVKANIIPVVKDVYDHDAVWMVTDENVNNLYGAKKGTYVDAQTGLNKDGWIANGANISGKLSMNYATAKVSVDNNTLDLVNGVLSNAQAQEVANSAFAVKVDDSKLYRRFNTEAEGVASDDPDVLKFFRVNATTPEYLYEDATSKYSAGKDFNFLGVEGKGDAKNAAMYVDTAYVRNNTKMPQYLIFVDPTVVAADTTWCNATESHKHDTLADSLACVHTSITPAYVSGRLLVNLQDSVNANTGAAKAKYQWNNQYTRLGFVEATHINDSVVIKNTGDKIFLGDNKHKNVAFSFRLIQDGSNNFLIESEGDKIVPSEGKGGWIKIQNGVPVIAHYASYNEAAQDAEIFNVEATDEAPTANEGVEVSEVSVVAANGAVIVKGAAGKNVAISNILGQTIANTVVASDNATISVPAGIVVVAVEGEEAVKVVVK